MAPQQQKNRLYFIKTYGCQMNGADSAKLAGVLEAYGYQAMKRENKNDSNIRGLEICDFILVNTCVVRQNAEDRAAGYIASLKGLKAKNPDLKIALCGCYVTEPGRDVTKQFPHVDLFLGPGQPEKLKEFLTALASVPSPRGRGGQAKHQRVRAKEGLVTIMTGCDNYCSYCVVPYVRGRESSRPIPEVLEEIKQLLDRGATAITLLGQNVNSYTFGLAELLRQIGSAIHDPQSTIHFLTSHPRDMSDEIVAAVHELPYVAKEFVMPLQSGDDEILAKMNRGYTFEHYLERVNKIRALLPGARITTDILVGFPGETEEQFQNTLQAIKTISFAEVHMFAYSRRPETAAAKRPDQLPEQIKTERLNRLIKTVRGIVKKT